MKFTLTNTQYAEMSKQLGLLTRITGIKNVLIKLKYYNDLLTFSTYGPLGKLETYLRLSSNDKFVHGSVVVKEDFIKLIKTITVSGDTVVSFALNTNNSMAIKLSNSKSKYSVKCLAPEVIADIDFGEYVSSAAVSAEDIIKGLNVKLFCKSDGESTDVFSSINMSVDKGILRFIASDTTTVVDISYKRSLNSQFAVLIPNQVANIIQAILSINTTNIKFGVTGTGHGLVISDNFKYLFSTFTGKYPDITQILSFRTEDPLIVRNQELLDKLQVINSLTSFKVVQFIASDGLVIKNTDTETLDVEEFVPAKCKTTLSFQMILKYLIVFLSQFKAENLDVTMYVGNRILIYAEFEGAKYSMVTTPVIER